MGIGRNEACVLVLKQAFRSDKVTEIPLGPSEIISLVKDRIMRKWQVQWDSGTKARFRHKVHPDVMPPVKLPRLARRIHS